MAGDMVRSRSEAAAMTPLPGEAVAGIGGRVHRTKRIRIILNRSVKARGKAGGKR